MVLKHTGATFCITAQLENYFRMWGGHVTPVPSESCAPVKTDNQWQVVDAYDYACIIPVDRRGTKLLDLDTHYCSVDIGFFYFISSTSLVLLTLLGSFIYHLLRWQVVYAYYLFQAYLYDTKRRNVRVTHQYDAFVSYNGHDEPWVLRELLPELEGNKAGSCVCITVTSGQANPS